MKSLSFARVIVLAASEFNNESRMRGEAKSFCYLLNRCLQSCTSLFIFSFSSNLRIFVALTMFITSGISFSSHASPVLTKRTFQHILKSKLLFARQIFECQPHLPLQLPASEAFKVVTEYAISEFALPETRDELRKILSHVSTAIISDNAPSNYLSDRLETSGFDNETLTIYEAVPSRLSGGPTHFRLRIHEFAHAIQRLDAIKIHEDSLRLHGGRFRENAYVNFLDEKGAMALESLYLSHVSQIEILSEIQTIQKFDQLSDFYRNFYLRTLRNASMSVANYLSSEWVAGRYAPSQHRTTVDDDWRVLNQNDCAQIMGKETLNEIGAR